MKMIADNGESGEAVPGKVRRRIVKVESVVLREVSIEMNANQTIFPATTFSLSGGGSAFVVIQEDRQLGSDDSVAGVGLPDFQGAIAFDEEDASVGRDGKFHGIVETFGQDNFAEIVGCIGSNRS